MRLHGRTITGQRASTVFELIFDGVLNHPTAAVNTDNGEVTDGLSDYGTQRIYHWHTQISMTETQPTDAIDKDHLVETLLELLAFDTQNPPGETVAIVDYLEKELQAAGLETDRLICADRKPNLIAWFPGSPAPRLVLQGHLDTVPFDREVWGVDPLGERDGERIYGRGATDMKGALAAMVEVARVYTATESTPETPLGFAFVSDEEVADENAALAALDLFDERPVACVIGEQTGTPERPSVAAADRGNIWLRLEATGTAAHGSRPAVGENAIDRLYDTVDRLRDELRSIEFDLPAPVEALLPDTVDYYTPAMGEEAATELFQRPTVNLGMLSGGEAINSVPATARAALDIRLTAGVAAPPICDRIRSFIADVERVDIDSLRWTEGTYERPDAPLVAASVAAAGEATDNRVFRRSATGGGDAKTLRNAGISTVEFAIGADTAHSVDEWTSTDALEAMATAYTALPAMVTAQQNN